MNISYVITVFNKAPYITDVIDALATEYEQLPEKLEYIFIDDGSSDDSVEQIRKNQDRLPGQVIIIKQENQGAAVATNVGVDRAQHEWIRLLDGDDIPSRQSTYAMYQLAKQYDVSFVIGSYGYFRQGEDLAPQIPTVQPKDHVVMSQNECLKRFIKNFNHNSSCILVKKSLFMAFKGADTRLVSPDYTLALRAVASTDRIVRVTSNVSLMVEAAPGRLSAQIARSRYDSILAIYYLAHELLPNRRDVALAVYKRACSRSYRYAKTLKNRPLWHFLRYIRSRLFPPENLKKATFDCLTAYTPDRTTNRPVEWTPGRKKR
ncbi:glycosyltransferase family 2 protein [Thalassospira marina]|uniref:Glycosyltransferase 2-like domain-containing protein n=1 Tax=Thalassospira marina TaxID=2048283 RepID=A0ABN5FH66_9PROT|nr:glycosyltransferase family 2 protein [Thalassospira marina]AUG53960.1 hypothetical protein CSC3H3_15450 [Thalassospira marina]